MGSKSTLKRLTELELDIMKVIWGLGESTIGDVNTELKAKSKKKYAYTTVATMMKILEKKKFLKIKKSERAHKYVPLIKMDIYEKSATDYFVDKVLDGKPARLVMRLLDDTNLNEEELKIIKQTLEMRLKK